MSNQYDLVMCDKCDEQFEPEDTVSHCSGCLPKDKKWIRIKDKLPQEKTFKSIYIVTIFSQYKNKKFIEPLHYIGGQWFTMPDEELLDIEYEVTHWMEMPDVPEDDDV